MGDRQYDNNLRGVLFQNDRRREGKKDPQYTGQCEVDGVEYWLAGWKHRTHEGKPYMSLSLTLKEPRHQRGSKKGGAAKAGTTDDFDDDIPF